MYHSRKVGGGAVEIDTSSPLLESAIRGVARSHAEAGTRHRVRLPITLEMLLDGEAVSESWGKGGHVMWMFGCCVLLSLES